MNPTHVLARTATALVLFGCSVVWLAAAAGALPAGPSGDRSAGRVATRTLNPFTAMDCVSTMKAWAVSLEANVKTVDGGATWKHFSLPGDMRYDPQAVDFVNARIGFIVAIDRAGGGAKAVVLKSTNGGASWTVKKRFSFDLLAGVSFATVKKGWVVGRGGRIYKTYNGGASWVRQASPTGKTLYAVTAVNATRAWAVGAAGTILRTTNGGHSWKRKSVSANDLYSVDFVSGSRGWAAGGAWNDSGGVGEIYATTNGGAKWTALAGPGAATMPALAAVDFWNALTGIAGGIGALVHSADGGATWPTGSPAPSGIAVVGLKMASATVGFAACTNYTIMKTADGGATWTTVLAPTF